MAFTNSETHFLFAFVVHDADARKRPVRNDANITDAKLKAVIKAFFDARFFVNNDDGHIRAVFGFSLEDYLSQARKSEGHGLQERGGL